jgi:hypothetical protein
MHGKDTLADSQRERHTQREEFVSYGLSVLQTCAQPASMLQPRVRCSSTRAVAFHGITLLAQESQAHSAGLAQSSTHRAPLATTEA